jgi:SAM-dependent methyltransferase
LSVCQFPAPKAPSFDPLELYASAIDTSDYVTRIAPLVRRLVPAVGELLDVGSGGGQLGAALRSQDHPWTAIEPSPTMIRRLTRLHSPPRLVAEGWQTAGIEPASYDTVLAATMPAFLEQPQSFLDRCLTWARRTVVWVVPAHARPRGLCFAGCLPSEWHREDETPGIDIVLGGLSTESRPHDIAFVDWTFSGVIADVPALAGYLADRLDWSSADERRPLLESHLARQARPHADGWRLDIPRKSAVLVWRQA